jgi:hypothetical protein
VSTLSTNRSWSCMICAALMRGEVNGWRTLCHAPEAMRIQSGDFADEQRPIPANDLFARRT